MSVSTQTPPAPKAALAEIVFNFFEVYKPAEVSRYLRQIMLQYITHHQSEPAAEPLHPAMLIMLYDLFEVLDVVGEELSNGA